MKKRFICYDGVENDVSYHGTEEEALKLLKYCIENGLDDGEWYDGVENSFVAEIKYKINPVKVPAPEEYKKEGISNFIEMEIEKSVPIFS